MASTKAVEFVGHEVWSRLLSAELNAAYCVALARHLRARHAWAKWIIAAAACVPFVTKLNEVSSSFVAWGAAIAPLIAVTLPIWNPDKSIEAASTLHGKYSMILPQLRSLWRDVVMHRNATEVADDVLETIQTRLTQLDAQCAEVGKDLTQLPDIRKIKARAVRSAPSYDEERPFDPRATFETAVLYQRRMM